VANRTVKVTITADVTGAVANLKTLKGTLSDFGGELDRLALKRKGAFNALTNAAGAAGLGLVGAFAAVTNAAAGFDKQMSAVAAVSDASGKALDGLRLAAIQAGKDTAFSATDAARAEEELAKAGVSTGNILGGGLKGALDLAAAGQMDLADAATIAAQAMNLFHLNGSQVPHIADVLAASANKSAADMKGMGDSLKQGGLVASQFGLTLEQTVGTLSAFADRALVGSDAGTSLKTMLQALANPSQQSADLMRQLGLRVYDTSGKFVGITALAGQLQDKLGGLSQAERDHALAQIFGSDAMRAAAVLYDQGAAGIQGYIDAVNDSGAASDTAAKKMDNLAGDLEKLKGSLETLAITGGSGGASAGLRGLVQGLDNVVSSMSTIPSGVQQFAVLLAGIGGAALLTTAGLAKMRQKSLEMQDTLSGMGDLGKKASGGLGTLTGIVGKLTVALVAAQLASAAFGSDASGNVKQVAATLTKFGRDSNVIIETLSSDLKSLDNSFGTKLGSTIEGLTGAGALFNDSITHAHQRIASMDTALAAMVSSGHADDAQKAFQRIAEQAKSQGISMDKLNAAFPQYIAMTDGSTASQQANVKATADQKAQLDLLHGSLQDAIDATGSLKNAFDKLNGASIDVAEGQIHVTEAVDRLDKSMKENGNSFDASTVKGAANRQAFIDAAKAARDHAQAVYDMTGSVEQANTVFQQDIERANAAARAHNADAGTVRDLDKAYGQLPPMVTTKVNTPGLDDAVGQARRANDALDRLNGRDVTANVNVHVNLGAVGRAQNAIDRLMGNARGGVYENLRGGIYQHAEVGVLRDASLYSARNPGRYMIAEPATRGEAFIPKAGNLSRSRAIADYVVGNWLGGSTSWGGGAGGGSGGPSSLQLAATFVLPSGEVVHKQLITYSLNTGRTPAQLFPDSSR
jgi:TP901 family phage tail tape measure protein